MIEHETKKQRIKRKTDYHVKLLKTHPAHEVIGNLVELVEALKEFAK